MTLRHLRIFIAVADRESITKAAKELYIAQPTVSVAIHELEEHYGICLFERLNKRLRITEDGQRLLAYARHIVGLFEEMERTLGAPDQRGMLRLGPPMRLRRKFSKMGWIWQLSKGFLIPNI